MSETSTPEPAHDILAAEAFAMPAADPRLHPHPLALPSDPTGIVEPHDVLAAEEFPMPAAREGGPLGLAHADGQWRLGLRILAGAAVVLLMRRLRSRR